MRLSLLTCICLVFVIAKITDVSAQNFTRIDAGLPIAHDPANILTDFDNDGDLDAFVAGMDDLGTPRAGVYLNNGGTFTLATSLQGVYEASCATGDFNNDGLADMAVCGMTTTAPQLIIYRNDGGGSFTDIGAGLTGLYGGGIAWGDHDNDGWADLLISGTDASGNPATLLYVNDGAGGFSDSGIPFTGLAGGGVAWCDIDNDEDLDFALAGTNASGNPETIIYINSDGSFNPMGAGIEGLMASSVAWGDFNDDTYPDLLVTGVNQANTTITAVYRSTNGGSFSVIAQSFEGVAFGSGIWGDFDNDGRLDLVVAGQEVEDNGGGGPPLPGEPADLLLYLNQGNEQFNEYSLTVAGIEDNAVNCGDYDNDSDLDLIVSGQMINAIGQMDETTAIFRNETANTNNPPSAPDGLSVSASDTDLTLSWNASTDDHTPSDGLNYNLRIGTQSDNMDLFSALADLDNGYRRFAARGNTGSNTSWSVYDLPFGEFFISVQAIDPSYAGSDFSAIATLEIVPTAIFTVTDSTCVFEDTDITYSGNASPAAQYDWDFDGAIADPGTGQGPHTVYWEAGGLKTVSLVVTENGVSSESYSQDVMVIEYPGTPGFIAGPTQLCQGAPVTEFYVPPVSDALSYEWSLTPPEAGSISGTSTTGTVIWNPDFHGSAFVSVRGSNYCGYGPWATSFEVVIVPLPEKPSVPVGPSALCQGSPNTSYSINTVAYANGYDWGLSPEAAGVIYGNGLQAEVDWSTGFSGEARIFVTGFNSCGAGPASDDLYVVVEVPPLADAGEDQTITHGSTAQLTGSASGGSGDYSYYWIPDTLVTDPNSALTSTVALDSSRRFYLRVTDLVTGCNDLDDVVITVIGGPLYVDALADPDTVCPEEEVSLLALTGGGSGEYSYSWTSDPAGFTADSANPVVYPLVSTTYYVEVSDGSQLVNDSVRVEVNTLPDTPGSIEGPMTVCVGDQDILYQIEAVPNAISYFWTLAEGMYGSSDSTSILVSWDDNFVGTGGSITVWSVNECGSSVEYSFIVPQVLKVPDQPGNIIGPDTLCSTTDTIVAYVLEENALLADDYEWMVIPEEAGYIISDGMEASMHWTQNWEGEALISVRSLNACFQSDWSEPYAVWAFSCVGISDEEDESIELVLYPNPADEVLGVRCYVLGEGADFELHLYDLYGRNIVETNHPGRGVVKINTSGIPAGMYILSLQGKNGLRVSKRILIQH